MHQRRTLCHRDIVSPETINLGTKGSRTFVQGHIVSGRPVTPPYLKYVHFAPTDAILGQLVVVEMI